MGRAAYGVREQFIARQVLVRFSGRCAPAEMAGSDEGEITDDGSSKTHDCPQVSLVLLHSPSVSLNRAEDKSSISSHWFLGRCGEVGSHRRFDAFSVHVPSLNSHTSPKTSFPAEPP